jgi:hypothetical protein
METITKPSAAIDPETFFEFRFSNAILAKILASLTETWQ